MPFLTRYLTTACARCSEIFLFFSSLPVSSVWPWISRLTAGSFLSNLAILFKVLLLLAVSLAEPVLNWIPFLSLSRSWFLFGQPFLSTATPTRVFGHLSRWSATPSLSESTGQPTSSTETPAGVFGHLSRASTMPSLSPSGLQPSALTGRPAAVFGHLSR